MNYATLKMEEGNDWPLFKMTSAVVAFLGFILFLFLLYHTVKFLKVYGLSNKWLVMFFIMLNLYIILKICFYVQEIFLLHGTWETSDNEWVDGVLGSTNVDIFIVCSFKK